MDTESWWDSFYGQHGDVREWYSEEENVKKLAVARLPPDAPLLHIGCGTSVLGEALRRGGFPYVLNLDFSAVGVHALVGGAPGAEASVMDALRLPLRDACVGAVVDKGTLDALCVGGASKAANAKQLLEELHRVTTDGAPVLLFSIIEPEDRLPLLQQDAAWSVDVTEIPATPLEMPSQRMFWLYTLTRKYAL